MLTSADRAAAQSWVGAARLAMGDLDGAAASAEQARSAAAEAGDHATTSTAMAALALVAELRGQLREALATIDDGTRLADQSPGRQGHRHPLFMTRGHILVELDRLDGGQGDAGHRQADQRGVRRALAPARISGGPWHGAIHRRGVG